MRGKLLRHKADLDKGAHTAREHAVVDFVHISEVVLRIALLVLGVDTVLVIENAVKADVLHPGNGLHSGEIVAPCFAHREIRVTGAEHLLPEMRQRRGPGLRIDGDVLLRARRSAGDSQQQTEDDRSLAMSYRHFVPPKESGDQSRTNAQILRRSGGILFCAAVFRSNR